MNDEHQEADRTYYIEPMQLDDIPEVSRVERRCFSNPWPESAYRRELRNAEGNHYIVLRQRQKISAETQSVAEQRGRLLLLPLLRKPERRNADPIIGFAGMWILFDESHVTTIGVAPEFRGQGLGELLLVNLFDAAMRRNGQWLTLEVRVTNRTAQALYEKYGFTRQGIRRHYYSDNGEDADIMWSSSLREPGYREHIERLRESLFARFRDTGIEIEMRDS
ncbi:MAG TPA: ribosomal protein S18-alanine N-acetyltransferase [Nitrolancea sp.]|nr:ribosomal protein S18-alanine N-acetyltransferase [Nitrolancea sp.]